LTLFPGIAIAALVLGLNFVGDALRDRLDPRAT
jgi:ABC-type dipeptide/oligopeptide/nickel transport system permease subunit